MEPFSFILFLCISHTVLGTSGLHSGKYDVIDSSSSQRQLAISCPSGWQKASWTYYISYASCCPNNPNYDPTADTTECTEYSACDYPGEFAYITHQTFQEVQSKNLVAFFTSNGNNGSYGGKSIQIIAQGKNITALIADTCGDADCGGCCTQNAKPSGNLIDMEYWTVMKNFMDTSVVSGEICWTLSAAKPSTKPTKKPISKPSKKPTNKPASKPSKKPTKKPTKKPASKPSKKPTKKPTNKPVSKPSKKPTKKPTNKPASNKPSRRPTSKPSKRSPSNKPSKRPTLKVIAGTATCTKSYTVNSGDYCYLIATNNGVTVNDITSCTNAVGFLTGRTLDNTNCYINVDDVLCLACTSSTVSTKNPSRKPTSRPTKKPTSRPTKKPASRPTKKPTARPTKVVNKAPSARPTKKPNAEPTKKPSKKPTARPSNKKISKRPTRKPSMKTGRFRVAPYYEMVVQGNPSLNGMKHVTFAFITADTNKNPSFEGDTLTSYTSTISSFQSSGGTAILSFGGYGSSELSFSQTNETKLQAAYEQFYTTYGVKIWDFDIEGSMATDVASQNRRNRVLSSLQAKYSDLEIYFTVSISETGLDSTGLALVNRTKNAGVKMSLVNVMLFDYYTSSANNNVNDSKTALTALRTQLDQIDKNLKIGATLMIGKDDSGKVLTVANTTTLLDWISVNIPSATHIAYWAMHRDTPGSNINTSAGITGFTAGDYLKTFKSYA